MMAEGVMAV